MTPWIAARAAATPDATALWVGDAEVRWSALHERALATAGALRRLGVAPGDVVALAAGGLDFAVAFHALDLCGATALPLQPRLTVDEVAFQLGDAGARLLLRGAGASDPGAACPTHALAALAATDAPEPIALPDADPEATLALVYTSGTTGRPRGARLSRRALTASAEASAVHLGIRPDDRWLLCMPLCHVGGLSVLVRSAVSGFGVVAHERFDAERVSRALDEDGITRVSLVPTMLARLLEARGERPAPATLRCVLLGGAGAPDALLARAAARGFPVAGSYGLTEAASQVATMAPERWHAPVGAGLVPLPGTQLRIAGAAPGEPGEIQVRSATLMSGYHGDAPGAGLHDGWLHTGDVGRLDAEGRLHVVGRLSDRIVSGGENIDPAEVEAVLASHPQVAEVAVAAVADAEFGERPAAWLVPTGDAPPSPAELARHCRERLAGFKIPVAFQVVAALPRSETGKLLRRRLRRGGDAAAAPSS